ncbi:terpene synthase metal-binding domain-containing protein [Myxococcus stipitatus DSM 14675]|uniref:Terpene synthase n=2 Tax=Myxococcus stipitatus TaxID=83455 RepID=L7UGH3_MYXSD|nr:terpene synthase metal-binding domain-containing protein [Myxococcus stipitatus DSM 14675]
MAPLTAHQGLSLYCPIPPAIHPRAEAVEAMTQEWTARQRLYVDKRGLLRLSRLRAGEFVSRIMPSGSEPALQVAVDFFVWLFAFDDAFCDEEAFGQPPHDMAVYAGLLGHLLDSPQTRILPEDPFAQSLRGLQQRLVRHASPAQLHRWSDGVRGYLHGQVWEAANRDAQRVCDLDTYITLRLYSGAVMACPTLIDVVNGQELSAAELSRPLVRAASEVAATLVIWDNDLISHQKEQHTRGELHNLITVLMHARRCSEAEARQEALRMRDALMALLLRLLALGQAEASRPLSMYLKGLGHFVRANIDWSNVSGRYFDPELRAPTDNVMACETPSRGATPLTPLPIVSVQWWWDCLSPEK